MGQLVEGKWATKSDLAARENGEFLRPNSTFRDFIQSEETSNFKAEKNRYHLFVSHACPWAHRTVIIRHLKGLENIISLSYVVPVLSEQGWCFSTAPGEYQDELHNSRYLHEIYTKAEPSFTGRITVPVLWDKHQQTIVNNESSEIIRMLNSEFTAWANNEIDLYPKELSTEIDAINDFIYNNINNGVYRCGFAATQAAYEEAFDQLFGALDKIENNLEKNNFLVNNQMTEADWRLFTTLIRFDSVYFGHFKCNLRPISSYPNLSRYLQKLYHYHGIQDTVHMKDIKDHYYKSHPWINPTGIVPKGPELDFML